MEFTGERVIPGEVAVDLWNEHVARYAFAARLAGRLAGENGALRVLDAGCGSGYGAAYLACWHPALQVVGVDRSEEALEYARDRYAAANLRYERGDCLALDFAQGAFDLVVAFEVIEHLAQPALFLEQACRVLGPAGHLVISTPNRHYYSEERAYQNPFHAREYDAAEFDELLQPFFPQRVIFAQNHAQAIAFFPCPGGQGFSQEYGCEGAGRFASAGPVRDQPHFLVAVCSKHSLAVAEPFVFVPSAGNMLRERERHIDTLEQDLAAREQTIRQLQKEHEQTVAWARRLDAELEQARQVVEMRQRELDEQRRELDERAAWARNLDAELEQARQVLETRQRELEERTAWARQLDNERERLTGIVAGLQAEVEKSQAEAEEKVAWARSLETDLEKARAALANLQREFEQRTAWALSLQAEGARLEQAVAERTAWAHKLDAELEAARADLRLIFGSLWYRLGKRLRLGPAPPSDPRRRKT